jgi:hypothetical protein
MTSRIELAIVQVAEMFLFIMGECILLRVYLFVRNVSV